MGVLERDPAATAATLEKWLAEVAGVAEPVVADVAIPGSTGWSNETILFEATWGRGTERVARRLVGRIAPSGHRVFPDDTFLRQHAVMGHLAGSTDVPMPAIHWLDQDPSWFGQPFWIMDRVDGDIPSDAPPYASTGWLADAGPDGQAEAWWSGIEALATVHRVDPGPSGVPGGDVGWHLDQCERFLAWAEDGSPHALSRRALDLLRRDRPPEPPEGHALVWGDSRLSNLVYRDRQVVAVLDWEMCTVGDPLQDLGYWLFADWALTTGSGCTRLPGFPGRDETAARWSALTGRSAEALDWYERFAGLRFTVIMLRMGKLLADMGLVPEGFAQDNLISQALASMLDRP